ncbi:nuclear transport factor 2 family protein [Shewanella submarina]|uniref:Nuclear transport factor 2 family protein n=1 Tax=Shewanella submarina TaxID=2016376 RepID=A0ABV7GCL7_9GAMM|nr:nuclear transport factor 2 family protein [Shewanella submarina]MCL1037039.1 nuclear transport factor 2 family protein [Shewanella submarina]
MTDNTTSAIATQTDTISAVSPDFLQGETAPLIRDFISLYQSLDKHNLHRLDDLYCHDAVFTDPLHTIEGRAALKQYFAGMYENLLHIRFDIHRVVADGNQACIEWTMKYAHKKLKGGKEMSVQGMSWLTIEDKITHHRDYFDAGQMLYEQLPLMGGAIRMLKNRMSV